MVLKNNANHSIKDSKSFDYKTTITGKLESSDATKAYSEAVVGNNPVVGINNPKTSTSNVTDAKLYVPVVALSNENDNKLL